MCNIDSYCMLAKVCTHKKNHSCVHICSYNIYNNRSQNCQNTPYDGPFRYSCLTDGFLLRLLDNQCHNSRNYSNKNSNSNSIEWAFENPSQTCTSHTLNNCRTYNRCQSSCLFFSSNHLTSRNESIPVHWYLQNNILKKMKSVQSTDKSEFGQNIKTNQALPTIRLNLVPRAFP